MNDIKVSFYPWTKKVGQVTLEITSMFLNLSLIKYYKYLPADSLTISLIEVKGDIRSKAQGSCLEAR